MITNQKRDEAIANTLFLAWKSLAPIIERGECDDTMMTSTVYYSMRATRSGRVMRATRNDKSRELWNHARCIHVGLNVNAFIADRDAIPDIVSFRVDTPAWLDSLPDNQRQRAVDLSDGSSTSELASQWHVTPSAVSQTRKQLAESYAQFMHSNEED